MRRYIFLNSNSRHALVQNCERLLYVPLREIKRERESSNKRHCVLFIAVSPPWYFSGHCRQVDLRICIRFLSPPRNSGICFHWDLAFSALLLFSILRHKIYLPPICFIVLYAMFRFYTLFFLTNITIREKKGTLLYVYEYLSS